jgi:hypothetical protein
MLKRTVDSIKSSVLHPGTPRQVRLVEQDLFEQLSLASGFLFSRENLDLE